MRTAASWSGSPSIRGSTESIRMGLLTVSLVGMQFTWGLEMTYCTPYLLQLGLTKSMTSLVWVAGPLSGLIVQPVIGAIADKSTSKYGRRRPFMLGGCALMGASLIMLGWASEIVGIFVSDEATKKTGTILVAVLSIYAVDFTINGIGACCRSLIVDTLPIPQQQLGSAWAARMSAFGHVIGYFVGTFDLVGILPTWLGGDTQFKKMTCVAIGGLWIAVGLTSWAVTERVLLEPAADSRAQDGVMPVLKNLWERTLHLPPRIQAIFWVQFWSWLGWFPFLMYSSTWIGETYYRYEHPETPPSSPANSADPNSSHDTLGNIGRLGSLSLVIFSIVTFTSSVFLPYFVRAPDAHMQNMSSSGTLKASFSSATSSSFTPRPPRSLSKSVQTFLLAASSAIERLEKNKPDLVTAWILSNVLFACIMVWAPLVRSLAMATTIVAAVGVPWAITCWAPFAEMGVEINRMVSGGTDSAMLGAGGYSAVSRPSADGLEEDNEIDLEVAPLNGRRITSSRRASHRHSGSDGVLRLHHERDSDSDDEVVLRSGSTGAHGSTGELAGLYLGVLNVYTVLPQFVSTFISWIVFSLLEPGKKDGDDGSAAAPGDSHKWLDLKKDAPNAIAVCLFIGALGSLCAAEAARRLRKMGPTPVY